MRRSAALLWRKASSSSLRWWNHGAAAGSRESLPVTKQPFGEEVALLQQARRCCSRRTSALVQNGPSAAAGVSSRYPSRVQQSRFASSAVKGLDIGVHEGDEGLLHVLRCVAEGCLNRAMDITERKPPRPFILVKDEPGEIEMTLTRIYGLEDITMSCVLQLVSKKYQRKPEVGEDPESRTKMLQLTISLAKSDASPALKFLCECYRDGFAIHQVDLEYEDEEQTVYRPYFSNGKEVLVNCFQRFLYDRGLNADLAGYIAKHLERKRLLKSAAALKKIIRFLEADSSPKGQTED
ncbi:unnamed protein product [Calypogeia fissa]